MPDLLNLDVEWVSLVDRAAVRDPEDTSQPMRFLVWKRDNHNQGGHMTPEEMRAALEKAEKERDELKSQLEKSDATAKDTKEALDKAQADIEELKKAAGVAKTDEAEEINKEDLPEPVRKALEKAEADRKASDERAEKAEKAANEASELAKSEREERLNKEFLAKADAFKALPVKADEFGPVLKSAADKLSKEEFEALEAVLKAADEQMATSELFKEQGRSGSAAGSDSVEAEVQKKAEELKKADSKLTDAQAFTKALDSDRELQARYLDEVRG